MCQCKPGYVGDGFVCQGKPLNSRCQGQFMMYKNGTHLNDPGGCNLFNLRIWLCTHGNIAAQINGKNQ